MDVLTKKYAIKHTGMSETNAIESEDLVATNDHEKTSLADSKTLAATARASGKRVSFHTAFIPFIVFSDFSFCYRLRWLQLIRCG